MYTGDTKKLEHVKRMVWAHYRTSGRHNLPWRTTTNPYHILVSEVMLQQTQVDRVIPKYQAFLKRFPTVAALAEAPLRDVLTLWQGLGYNRRAKALHEAARHIVRVHKGKMPRTYEELALLPGVGPYTASAVCAFAYNQPVVMIETNIRTVFFYHLLGTRTAVPDSEIRDLAAAILDNKRARLWYWALMDYGAHLKRNGIRVNSQSKHYTKQSKFEGSDRQIRGAILRAVCNDHVSRSDLYKTIDAQRTRIDTQLDALTHEGLVLNRRGRVTLAR